MDFRRVRWLGSDLLATSGDCLRVPLRVWKVPAMDPAVAN